MPSSDPYFDESIGDLRNLIGATSPQELNEAEAQIVFANELTLSSADIARTNNLQEVCAIHKHLFGDIYDWAGKIRTVDIIKNESGADFFLIVSRIIDASNYVFSELSAENSLKNMPLASFVQRLAYYYDQLNYIHPFREGNGRTQRLFWTRVAHDAGYDIDWDKIVGDENNEASRLAANDMDLSKLIAMFTKITSPADDKIDI